MAEIVNENKTKKTTVSGTDSGHEKNDGGKQSAGENNESANQEAALDQPLQKDAERGAESGHGKNGRRRKIKARAAIIDVAETQVAARSKVFDQIQRLREQHTAI